MAQQTASSPAVQAAPARKGAAAREEAGDNFGFLVMTIAGVVAVCGVAVLLAVKF